LRPSALKNTDGCAFLCEGEFMSHSRRVKDSGRFYLLPGQGGSAHRRKQSFIIKWSVIAALIVSAIMAGLMYWLDRPKL
jgi:hypothetical protein